MVLLLDFRIQNLNKFEIFKTAKEENINPEWINILKEIEYDAILEGFSDHSIRH